MITEKNFEDDVESMLLSGGWRRGDEKNFDRELAPDTSTLFEFIRTTQASEWQRLRKLFGNDTERVFYGNCVRRLTARR